MSQEMLGFALDATMKQLKRVLEGLAEQDWDKRSCDAAETPREMVLHLGESYEALLDAVAGREHEWGSFSVPDTGSGALMTAVFHLRDKACAAALQSSDPEIWQTAIGYLALHDAYHVGQLATLRLTLDPNWNAYSIYE